MKYIIFTASNVYSVRKKKKDGSSEQRVTRDVDGHLWKGVVGVVVGHNENSKKTSWQKRIARPVSETYGG